MISIGNLDIRLVRNDLECWGLGIEYYSALTTYEDQDSLDCFTFREARIFRIDLLFFSINFTNWSKQNWNED